MRLSGLLLCWVSLAGAAPFGNLPYLPKPIEARVPWYTVKPDLSNVSNATQLPASVTAEQRAALARQGFFAQPTVEDQLFYIYENNAYRKMPSFVTTDAVLHTYHIFYDYALRYLEQEFLGKAVVDLSRGMLARSLAQYQALPAGLAREAAGRNVVFFAVPLRLMGEPADVPADFAEQIAGQVALCEQAEGEHRAITGALVRFSLFKPRGHYSRSEFFQRYFRAMSWYGNIPMPLGSDDEAVRLAPSQAALMCAGLGEEAGARQAWETVYEPTTFYVGAADDLVWSQLLPLVRDIFDGPATVAEPERVARFIARVEAELPAPGIAQVTDEEVQGREFRLMGQRFIPDSRILQELVWPKVKAENPRRVFPVGLDVFAVLGNPRAAQILDDILDEPRYDGYLDQRAKLQAEIQALTPADWQQNLYYGWLYCLLPLQQPRPEGWPMFMRNLAWRDKSLVTSLGSWAELRHDTILYAKQSGVEMGAGEQPEPVAGYVEPEVEVYERLAWLLRFNRDGLRSRNLYGEYDRLQDAFDQFIDLCGFLANCSRKELRGELLNSEERSRIEDIGGYFESLMLAAASLTSEETYSRWWEVESQTDRNMAVVADVHTGMNADGSSSALEEAVGQAAEIWVVTPQRGNLVLTRGATFTYYEFLQDANDRLTDEQWQEQLAQGRAPAMPAWTKTYMVGDGIRTPVPNSEMGKYN